MGGGVVRNRLGTKTEQEDARRVGWNQLQPRLHLQGPESLRHSRQDLLTNLADRPIVPILNSIGIPIDGCANRSSLLLFLETLNRLRHPRNTTHRCHK